MNNFECSSELLTEVVRVCQKLAHRGIGGTLKVSKSTRWSQNLPQGNQKVLRVPSYGQRVIWDPTCSIWFNLRSSCIFKHKRHSWWIYAAWSTAISVCYRTCKGKKPSSLYGRAGLFALCVISCHEIRSWCLEMSTLSVSPPCQLLIVTILEGWPHTLYKVMQKMFRPVIFKYKKSFSSQGPICILSRVISMPDPKHTNDGLFNWDLRSCCTESAFRTGSSTFLLNHGWNQIWMIQLAPSHQHHSNWRHINLCSEMLCNYIQCNEIQHVIETHLIKPC